MAYCLIDPIFPKFLNDHSIDKKYLGFGHAIFAGMSIVSSAFTGKVLLVRMSRMYGCFIGAAFVITYLLGLGCLDFMQDKSYIIYAHFAF